MIFRSMFRTLRNFAYGLLVALLIAACQTPTSIKQSSPTSVPASADNCRTVEHEMGVTEVCGQPQKIAVLSAHILDNILALGAQPAGYAEVIEVNLQTYDNPTEQIPHLGKWVTTKPVGLGTRPSPSLERLTQLKPDIILGESWANSDEYSSLSQIAPTLLFNDRKNPNEPQSWQQNIEGIAQALGREARGKELLAAYDRQIAQARTALEPVLKAHPRILLINSDLDTYVGLSADSTASRLLKDIGFEIVVPPGAEGNVQSISWEILPQVESDIVILMYCTSCSGGDDLLNPLDPSQKQWTERPLIESMDAFQKGRFFFVDMYLWTSVTRGPLTDQLILEALPDLLLPTVAEEQQG